MSFTGLSPEDLEKLRALAPPDANERRPAQPPLPAPAQLVDPGLELELERTHQALADAPKSTPPGCSLRADALEAIVRVLLRKGIISRSDFAEEIEKLRVVKS